MISIIRTQNFVWMRLETYEMIYTKQAPLTPIQTYTVLKRTSPNQIKYFYSSADFHGLDKWMLIRALKTLEEQGKAEIMDFDGNEGVKFFS